MIVDGDHSYAVVVVIAGSGAVEAEVWLEGTAFFEAFDDLELCDSGTSRKHFCLQSCHSERDGK